MNIDRNHYKKRVTVVHDIIELKAYLQSFFPRLWSSFDLSTPLFQDQAITWLIAKEIHDVFCVSIHNHDYRNRYFEQMHDVLNHRLNCNTMRLVSASIMVPRPFNPDDPVEISIKGNDLYMTYWSLPPKLQF